MFGRKALRRIFVVVTLLLWIQVPFVNAQTGTPYQVVVFLQGLCTTLPTGFGPPTGFQALQLELSKSIYGYRPTDFLAFSYSGGGMLWDGSRYNWLHFGYSENLPIDQGWSTSVARLDAMLKAYSAYHPNARYVLVGHSFGGLVAMEYLATYPSTKISKVITIDSPLQGNPLNIANWVQTLARIGKRCLIGAEGNTNTTILINRYKLFPYYAEFFYSRVIDWAKGRGIGVYTIGNLYDGLYTPQLCSLWNPSFLTGGDPRVQWLNGTQQYYFLKRSTAPTSFNCVDESHGFAARDFSAAAVLARFIGRR